MTGITAGLRGHIRRRSQKVCSRADSALSFYQVTCMPRNSIRTSRVERGLAGHSIATFIADHAFAVSHMMRPRSARPSSSSLPTARSVT